MRLTRARSIKIRLTCSPSELLIERLFAEPNGIVVSQSQKSQSILGLAPPAARLLALRKDHQMIWRTAAASRIRWGSVPNPSIFESGGE